MRLSGNEMRLLLCLIVVTLISAGCSSITSPQEDADLPCTPQTAARGDIRTMIANPDEWLTRCVTIRGTSSGFRLYADVDAFYQPTSDWQKDSSNGGTLGLQWYLGDASDRPEDGELELTGTMQDCQAAHDHVSAMNAADSNRIVMVSGYCHTSLGLYYMIEHARRLGPGKLNRQLPEHAGRRYGDLEPAPAGWLLRQDMEQRAAAFLAAVRTRDEAALNKMHVAYEFADAEPDDMRDMLLNEPRSPFGRLRTGPASPQMQMFVTRMSVEDRASLENSIDKWQPVICFCLVRDCEKLWPIRVADADNLSSRPYACTRVIAGTYNFGPAIWLDTPRATGGLVEPAS